MKFNPNIHNRRSIRIKEFDYSAPGEYYITICVKEKECILGEIIGEKMQLSEIGMIVKRCWQKIPEYYPNVGLDVFVIMPNHIHGIIILNDPVGVIHELPLQMKLHQQNTKQNRRNMLIPKIIGRFKMVSAKEINVFQKITDSPVWQRNYYDHIIHNEKELHSIRDYIINNPLKWFYDEENGLI